MIRRAALVSLVPALLAAQQNFDTVTVKAQLLRGGVYMITGAGGNIGLSVGNDAAFLVDDQFAPLTPKIIAAVASVTSKPIKFVVNTHWHGDHSGGNENFGNDDDLVAFHVPPAHTDGDVIIYITKANVVHMGDTFFTTGYPFIHTSTGGNVNGMIGAQVKAAGLTADFDARWGKGFMQPPVFIELVYRSLGGK